MKVNLLTALFTTTLLFHLNAQIPNGSFEVWIDFDQYEDPDMWFTENAKYEVDGIELVKSDNETMDGDWAARLENDEDDNNNVIRAKMVSGWHDLNDWPGFAYAKRPESLTGWYLFEPKDQDSCYVIVELTRFNSITKQRDLIGKGRFSSDVQTDNYEPFVALITYYSTQFPDTATITVYSGRFNGAVKGSRLTIDALTFDDLSTGDVVIIDTDELGIVLSPNPAQNILQVVSNDNIPSNYSYQIKNSGGTQFKQGSLSSKQIDVSSLSNGTYYLAITDAAGVVKFCGSFMVQR